MPFLCYKYKQNLHINNQLHINKKYNQKQFQHITANLATQNYINVQQINLE